jgi:hypothetical protein
MTLPAIGERITTVHARALCVERGAAFDYIVARIDATPNNYTSWVFDGASLLPDKLVAEWLRIPNLTEIALKHDLRYAYGELGNRAERLRADDILKQDLLADGASPLIAKTIHKFVRLGGSERIKTRFSWGFARIDR